MNWRVFLVGAAFKKTGQKSAADRSQIDQHYGFRDILRQAGVSPCIRPGRGLNSDDVIQWATSEEGKDRFRQEPDAALDRGVSGSPFFFVGDEGSWGSDRMNTLEWWLITHGKRPAEVFSNN